MHLPTIHEHFCLSVSAKKTTWHAMWLPKSRPNLTVCDFRIYAYITLQVFWYNADFILILVEVVEKVETKQQAQEAIEALKDVLMV